MTIKSQTSNMDSSNSHVIISINDHPKADKSQDDQAPTTQVIPDHNPGRKNEEDQEEAKRTPNNNYVSQYIRVKTRMSKHDMKRLTHSVKVGIALVLVSLLYLLNPLYKQVGVNAMWAIMTVVVVFEFYAGS